MGDSNDRLRQARERAGFKSAAAALKRFPSWVASTYRSHENGQTPVPREDAARYARAFKVSAGWILTGDGSMEAQNLVKLMGRVGAGAEITPDLEQIPEGGLDEIEVPLSVGIDPIAFEIVGNSMLPQYDDGDLIVCTSQPRDPEQFINALVVVRTANGRRYVKKLRPGSKRGLYNLESFNAEPLTDVKIAWLGEILVILPARRLRKTDAATRRAAG